MSDRSQPWQIAMDLEKLAHAVDNASDILRRIDRAALDAAFSAVPNLSAIDDDAMFKALMALSNKYQAIADAQPDERAADELRTGYREEDFA